MATDLRDVIRSGLAAWSRGDLEGVLETLDPDCEFVPSGAFPGLEPFTAAMRGTGGSGETFVGRGRTSPSRSSASSTPSRRCSWWWRISAPADATASRSSVPTNLVFTGGEAAIKRIAVFDSWETAFEAAGLPLSAGG